MLFSTFSYSEVKVYDDEDNVVTLKEHASRIVSLSPHITEILFSSGAGGKIVGAVPYSDYPEEAKIIPRVSAYPALDIESIISLKPDLVIVWASSSANNKKHVKKMKSLGLTVFMSEPKEAVDIFNTIKKFGKLAGTSNVAEKSAGFFLNEYNNLKFKYAKKEKIKVFYQFWNKPLMTVNDQHLISNIINLCGGVNVFSNLYSLTPKVSVEAVIASNAEVIIAGGKKDKEEKWASEWEQWLPLTKAKNNNIYFIEPDLLSRMGPRILQGADKICQALDKVRNEK